MSDAPVGKFLYDFLAEQIAALPHDHPFYGVNPDTNDPDADYGIDLHRTPYQPFDKEKKWFGIRLGNTASVLAPNPGATEMEEFDADLPLITFARIRERDKSDLETAVSQAFALAKWLGARFVDATGVTLNNRVTDARVVDKCPNDFREWYGDLYAVWAVPMLINDSGSHG
jgi:hypothetical protein